MNVIQKPNSMSYIARDRDGSLCIYEYIPERNIPRKGEWSPLYYERMANAKECMTYEYLKWRDEPVKLE